MMKRRSILKGFAAVAATPFLPGYLTHALAAEGDTIRFAIGKPAGDMNPHVYKGLWGAQDLMFEPLITYDKGGELLPGLATKWELSADGRVLKLDLREGVTFHDGAPWNAEAMKWNLDRWIKDEGNSWINHARLFENLEIIGDHSVAMHFKEAPLSLLYELTYIRPARYLSPASVAADGSYQTPIGTGPWKQVSADDTLSAFEQFDGYWGDKPGFARLELVVLPDSRGRMAALRAGEIDITGGDFLAPITANEAATLKEAGLGVEISSGIAMLLGFNPDRNVALADKRVRKAISIGFDRAAIATVLYQGLSQPAGSIFPPSVPLAGTQFPANVYAPDEARALLGAAGWTGEGIRQKDGKPLSIEIVVSNDQIAGSRSMAEVMQAQLAEIGIDLTIRSVDHASRHSDIPARKYDMALFLTFGAPYEPFGTMLGYLYSPYDNGVDGKMVMSPDQLDPLLLTAMSANQATVQSALQAVFDWIHAETALAPLMFTPSIWAYGSRIEGFTAPATEYDTPYEGLRVKQG
ncbi:MAG: ABC transporter substrate-binding protein [Pseudomonadota bacterium]